MFNLFKRLFGNNRLEELKKENIVLKQKLSEKQEVINQTNAYWKKRFYRMKKHPGSSQV